MTATEIVRSLRHRGILVVPSGDGRLRYCPREALSEADRDALALHRAAILALLESDPVGWRAAVMATQIRGNGAIPLLFARPGMRLAPGSCYSCGDPRIVDRLRCRPCVAGTIRVLAAAPTAGISA
jgi:hypothetical protein